MSLPQPGDWLHSPPEEPSKYEAGPLRNPAMRCCGCKMSMQCDIRTSTANRVCAVPQTDGIQMHIAERSTSCGKHFDSQTSDTLESLEVGLLAAMCPMGLQMSSGWRQLAPVQDAKRSSHLLSMHSLLLGGARAHAPRSILKPYDICIRYGMPCAQSSICWLICLCAPGDCVRPSSVRWCRSQWPACNTSASQTGILLACSSWDDEYDVRCYRCMAHVAAAARAIITAMHPQRRIKLFELRWCGHLPPQDASWRHCQVCASDVKCLKLHLAAM